MESDRLPDSREKAQSLPPPQKEEDPSNQPSVIEIASDDESTVDVVDITDEPEGVHSEDDGDVVITGETPVPERRSRTELPFSRNVRRRFSDPDQVQLVEERRIPENERRTSNDEISIVSSRNLTPAERQRQFRRFRGPPTQPHRHIHTHINSIGPADFEDGFRQVLTTRMGVRGEELLQRAQQLLDERYGGRGRRRDNINTLDSDLLSTMGHSIASLFGSFVSDPNFISYGIDGQPGDIERSVMERIERDNERELDRKLENENNYNRRALVEKRNEIKKQAKNYTSDIKQDSISGCEVCGVTLGEGISEDFKTNLAYADDLKKYREEFDVPAPWFCTKQLTQADKDLSKRVFLSKCGHVFCGRCIKNIGNRPKKKSKVLTIDNPAVYSPSKCPASGCESRFKAKSFFELYF